jgi:uncharacterized membrane protein
MGANAPIWLAGLSGGCFAADVLLWKKGATSENTSSAVAVRVAAELGVVGIAWAVARTAGYKSGKMTGKEVGYSVGSGVLTALGVILFGLSLSSGGVTSAVVANQSVELVGTAIGAVAFLKTELGAARWVAIGLAVAAFVSNSL